MNINLKTLGKFFSKNTLWDKPFRQWTQWEIERLCEAVFDAGDPEEGWKPPFIDERGDLVIPFRAPFKYRYWYGGQSILDTLKEIGASEETITKYTPTRAKREQS